jgi:hypothetical protein
MLRKQYLSLVFLFCALMSKAQLFRSEDICHDKEYHLSCYTSTYFKMSIKDQKLFSIYTKDSLISYDNVNSILRISTRAKDSFVIDLRHKTIRIREGDTDSLFRKIKKIHEVPVDTLFPIPLLRAPGDSCSNRPNFISMQWMNNLSLVSFGYGYCNLEGMAIVGPLIGSVNLDLTGKNETGSLTWNISLSPLTGDTTKTIFLEVKNYTSGELKLIGIYEDHEKGFEFVAGKSGRIEQIRYAELALPGLFRYQPIISYKQNGRVKKSRIPIKFCVCN